MTPHEILRHGIKFFNIDERTILGDFRHRDFAYPRHVIIKAMRVYSRIEPSYPRLGQIFNRDHTTIISAVKAVPECPVRSQMYDEFIAHLEALEMRVAA